MPRKHGLAPVDGMGQRRFNEAGAVMPRKCAYQGSE